MSEHRDVSIDFLLRQVARARAAGNVEPARPAWEACVFRATARVRRVVGAYRTVQGDAIPAHDREVVVNDALDRACRRMIKTLDKFNERSFMAAMAGCAENACKDYIRKLGAYEKGLHGSFDDAAYEGGGGGRYDDALYREAELRDIDDEQAFDSADRLERALGQMRSANQRRAVQMRRLGCENEEIAETLGVTVDNAYQLVSRGLRDLRGLMEP